jgi:hypothetical protein
MATNSSTSTTSSSSSSSTSTSTGGNTVEEALAKLREATELFLEECPQPALGPRLLTTFEVSVA